MTSQKLTTNLITKILVMLINELPKAKQATYQPLLELLTDLSKPSSTKELDGRKMAWSEERRATQGASVRSAAQLKRANQVFYLRQGKAEIQEITGWDDACRRVGISFQSLHSKLSAGEGLATFHRGGGQLLFLSKDKTLLDPAKLLEHREQLYFKKHGVWPEPDSLALPDGRSY